jgi:hypothetical protein
VRIKKTIIKIDLILKTIVTYNLFPHGPRVGGVAVSNPTR